jgi:hypothetical protein
MDKYIQHLRDLPKGHLETEIDGKIADNYLDLIHNEALSGPISETNAAGFMMEEYEILEPIAGLDLSGSSVDVPISAYAVGEQDPDKPYCGDRITVNATARIDDDGNIKFVDVEAEVNWPDEEDLREAATRNEDKKK